MITKTRLGEDGNIIREEISQAEWDEAVKSPNSRTYDLKELASKIAGSTQNDNAVEQSTNKILSGGPAQHYPTLGAFLRALETCPGCRDFWEQTSPDRYEALLRLWQQEGRPDTTWQDVGRWVHESRQIDGIPHQ